MIENKFELIKKLGAGHFGEVWLARDIALDVLRAVKFVDSSRVLNPTNTFQEAQLLKSSEHQNVIKIEEAGLDSDGRLYIAMEYLTRGSLEDEARGSYVHLTRVKSVMIDVLRGLEYAHSQKITHRDIKPANILVGNQFQGKLSDFGLAIPNDLDLSTVGVKDYYGYVLHIAPEVFGGVDYSALSDIYACGITMYRLVNGDQYLPLPDVDQLIPMIMEGKFPNRQRYRAFVPRQMRTVINKAMNIDPNLRYQTASEFRHAIEQLRVEKNWNEQTLRNGLRWTSGWNHKCYEVSQIVDQYGRWTVTVRKGNSRKDLRRNNKLSVSELTKSEADQHSRSVLQGFVTGQHA